MICEVGKAEAKATVKVSQSLGWSCDFTDDGVISVICGDGISFVASDGKIKYIHGFEDYVLLCADSNIGGAVLYLQASKQDDAGRILAFDKNGKLIYRENTSKKVLQIAKSGNAVYMLCADGVERVWLKNGERQWMETNTDQKVLLAVNEKEFLLCSSKKAQYLQMNS
jgi:hypothetical protein